MKKILLTMLVAGSSFFGYAQFTPGNLVVVQANEGAENYPTISLQEFTKAGAPQTKVDIASSGTNSTVLAVKTAGGSFEAYLSLSTDYSTINMVGYNVLPSATTNPSSSSSTKMILKVAADGSVNYDNSASLPNSVYIRSIALDGTDGWITSSGSTTSRVRYVNLAAAPPTVSNVSAVIGGGNSTKIFYGKLYVAASGSAYNGVYLVDAPKTTSTSAVPTQIVASPASTATDFVFFDTDADNQPDLLYLGTDGTGTANLYKYEFDSTTSAWVAKGSTSAPASITSHNRKVNGITGYKNADGKYVIYYSTFSNILAFVDEAAPSADLNISPDAETPDVPGEPTIIATAPTNSIFRGLSFTPGTTPAVLPVTLKSFSGKAEGEAIRLNWSTASEKNNSHFEILRSVAGNPSQTIGTVAGNGNSDVTRDYTFVDTNPVAGTNYYQLKQVDFNGKSEKSKVIAVKSGLKETALSVSNGEAEILVNIYAAKSGLANIYVSDISGHKVAAIKVSLEKGYNNIPINALSMKPGIYIVTLNSAGKNLSVKFVK